MKKFLSLVLALSMVLALAACGGNNSTNNQSNDTPAPSDNTSTTTPSTTATEPPTEPADEDLPIAETKAILDKYEYGVDYIALYEQFGADVTVDEVIEDYETGLAYIVRDGMRYELGLDFLTWAMVYNVDVPEGGIWTTADDVYATWWKLYIQRWNYLLPEVPLYSNEYYDLYNTQITGVQENPTNPYWGVADALIDWGSDKPDNSIIIGNTTDLSGNFRYSSYASSSPGAADLDIEGLTRGLGTVVTTKDGGYTWNEYAVKSHEEVVNDDGTKTFTITLHDDLKFSDGSPVSADDYIVRTLVFSTPVAVQGIGVDKAAGQILVGYDDFAAYDGTTGTNAFSGIRLLDEYTFSVTVQADYIPYFYDITYASFGCDYAPMWIGDAQIKDDGNGAYITDEFYAKEGDVYTQAANIMATCQNTDTTYPFSGAYYIESFDKGTLEAVLVKNPYYKGNYEGTVPSIERIIYRKIVSATQLADLQAGGIDVIAGITGGTETNEAIEMADASNGAFAYVHYSRAGYGKMGFRADYGPAQFKEVRQAIAYCMDRAKFAKDFTGGYGGVVDGPYYAGSWMYKAAVDQGMLLNAYATSADSAIAVLEEGGWVYDKDGNAYTSGVRYKQIHKDDINEDDKTYQSKDGAYTTSLIGDYYYMPLVLNWYGTSDNPFTDQLVTGFMEDANIATAGIVVQNTIGDFNPMLDELYQQAVYGYYSGTPMYSIFNFATNFTSTVYDYSWNMTIDPALFDLYSAYYIKDEADAYWLK